MKRTQNILLSVAVLAAFSSCKKYLDVNKNPNSATSSTPELVLPQAIAYTASSQVGFNDYGAWHAGYFANAGGYGGWGSTLTYSYTSANYTGLWTDTYDNLNDYEYVLNQTAGKDAYANFNAAARIMKVYNFQLLVDQYGDIPYKQAMKGSDVVSPKYDKAQDIYTDLYDQLDTAIATINGAQHPNSFKHRLGNADVLFNGDINQWKRLANTLKLKLLIRASKTPVFSGATISFDPVGFLTEDALINPGYIKDAGKQNPYWNTYHSNSAGTLTGTAKSRIPTHFALSFYSGNKIVDTARGRLVYRGFASNGSGTVKNQLGVEGSSVPANPTTTAFYTGASTSGSADEANVGGILKGRTMGMPLLLAAESYFLQAEAVIKGIITGDDKALFEKGILASMTYLYRTADNKTLKTYTSGTQTIAYNPNKALNEYITANTGSRLVNFTLASTPEEKIEAIVTQKYIALNMIQSHEGWAEFRRTGYPRIDNNQPLDPNKTFVSTTSQATTVDRLPGRILYPDTEAQLNSQNVPQGITVNGSFIFWDRRS